MPIMRLTDVPLVVTKYFAPEDLGQYQAGQLRFGTLQEYRGIEGDRTSDPTDTHVLCFSGEDYSDAGHAAFRTAREDGYPGHPRLTGAVSFNSFKLVAALIDTLREIYPEAAWTDTRIAQLWLGNVTYAEAPIAATTPARFEYGVGIDRAFTKPARFAPEKEFRIVLPLKLGDEQPLRPINLASEALLAAVTRPPSLIETP